MRSEGNPLIRAINIMGSRQLLIRTLGITAQRFNNWLNYDFQMGYEYAIAIEHLTLGEVKAEELTPQKTHLLKSLGINFNHNAHWLIQRHISVNRIIHNDCNLNNSNNQKRTNVIEKTESLRPIIIDTNYQIIVGQQQLQAYKDLKKKHISAFVLSLKHLIDDRYAIYEIKKYFLISERVAIGLALEKFMGSNHGGNRRQLQVQKYALEKGQNLRNFIAEKLGFGSHFTYVQGKKVMHHGDIELIQLVDNEKIAISSAAKLLKNNS